MNDLTGLELRLACDITRDGFAACDVAELCNDRSMLVPLATLGNTFAAGEKVAFVKRQVESGILRNTFKPFVVKYQEEQRFTPDHPLYRFGNLPAVQRVVDSVTSQRMRLCSADLWYVLPNAADANRNYGSSWHRDPEDRDTIKVYLFLTDVTPKSGPIEYVVGSHRANSKYAGVGQPQHYAPQDEVEAIPEDDKRRFCYPAGTLLFFHSGGLHRGGYTQGAHRINTVWTYVPEGAILPRNFTLVSNGPTQETRRPALV